MLQFGFMLIALIWKFDFSPFMVLIIAILNDGECLISELANSTSFLFLFLGYNILMILSIDTLHYKYLRNNYDDLKGQSKAISHA